MTAKQGMWRSIHALLVVVAASGMNACRAAGLDVSGQALVACPANSRFLRFASLDSVTLAESDSVFLGSPGAAFTMDRDGSAYIPDPSTNRILVFSRGGQLARTIGRTGGGPGEFQRIGPFSLVSGSTILQDDGGAKRVKVFERATGALLGGIPYDGYLSWIARGDSDYVFALIDEVRARVVATAPAREIRAGAISSTGGRLTAARVALPSEYARYHMLKSWADAKVLQQGDTLVAAFGGLDVIVRYTSGGAETDTFHVPTCVRRGTPPPVLDEWFRRVPKSYEDLQEIGKHTDNAISALLGMWRLGDGSFLVWYQDPIWESDGKILKGIAYLSLLSPDLSRACVDGKMEAPGINRVRLTLQGDTIAVLDQIIGEQGEGKVRSVIRRYRIDQADCTWLATRGQGNAR